MPSCLLASSSPVSRYLDRWRHRTLGSKNYGSVVSSVSSKLLHQVAASCILMRYCVPHTERPVSSYETYFLAQVLSVSTKGISTCADHESLLSILLVCPCPSVLSPVFVWNETEMIKLYYMQCHVSIPAQWVHSWLLSFHTDQLSHSLSSACVLAQPKIILSASSIFKALRQSQATS